MPYRLLRSADSFRGTFLFLAGAMFVPSSLVWAFEQQAVRDRFASLPWLPSWLEVWMLGIVFLVCSTTAMLVGLFSKYIVRLRGKSGRLGPELIGWGYVAAMAPPVIAAVIVGTGLVYGAPLAALPSALFYVILATAIYLASEWPNPRILPLPAPGDDRTA